LPHPFPFRGREGSAPAQVADWRCRKWDATVHRQPVFGNALHQSLFNLHRHRLLRDTRPRGKHPNHHNQKCSASHKNGSFQEMPNPESQGGTAAPLCHNFKYLWLALM
jgi:hypothetical protein